MQYNSMQTGQHRPEFIEPMFERIKEGYDIIGSRFITTKKGSSLRMIGSKMITRCY